MIVTTIYWKHHVSWTSAKEAGWDIQAAVAIGTLSTKFLLDKIVVRRLIVKEGIIIRPIYFAWYTLLILPITLLNAFWQMAFRYLWLILIGLFYTPRIDASPMPAGFVSMDTPFKVFRSMASFTHRQQYYVCDTFMRIFNRSEELKPYIGEDEDSKERARRKRIAKKWWFAVTMAQNPELSMNRYEEGLPDADKT